MLSGGPNSGLQDPVAARLLAGCKPQKCFVDHIEAYSLNEVTVNWNSALAWVANWAAEKSDRAAGCAVDYQVAKWGTGQTATLTVTNTGATPWTGWKLGFSFGGGQKITNGWSATWAQNGRDVTATNLSWNAGLAPGSTAHLGYVASSTTADADPPAFSVNGEVCTRK